jgi:streptomycin 6-kinase
VLHVPEVVRNRAVAAGATAWLDALPELIESLEREWTINIRDAYEAATEAFVAAASLDDGTPAVLKLLIARDGDRMARDEITTLTLAGGEGCARLLRSDVTRGALLVERLGPSMYDLRLPTSRRHEILCAVAARVWRPAVGSGLRTGAEKGRWLAAYVVETWEALDRPCSEAAIDDALACAARRIQAHDDERAVLVHGDVHQWNALSAGEGFKLVDPDGLLAEPEYDLGIVMREDPLELLDGDPFDRARRLARRTGLDVTAIWEWGVVERVATGLSSVAVGLQPVGNQMLRAADEVARVTG